MDEENLNVRAELEKSGNGTYLVILDRIHAFEIASITHGDDHFRDQYAKMNLYARIPGGRHPIINRSVVVTYDSNTRLGEDCVVFRNSGSAIEDVSIPLKAIKKIIKLEDFVENG